MEVEKEVFGEEFYQSGLGGGVRMELGVEEIWKDNCGINSQNIGVWFIWGGKEEVKMFRRFRIQK